MKQSYGLKQHRTFRPDNAMAELLISRTVDTQLKTHTTTQYYPRDRNTEDLRIEKHGKNKRPPRRDEPETEKPVGLPGLPRSHHPRSQEPGAVGRRWWRNPRGRGLAHPSPAFPTQGRQRAESYLVVSNPVKNLVFSNTTMGPIGQGHSTQRKHVLWPAVY